MVFEEFQEIATIENGELLEREMRSAMQHHQLVSYAFLGSKYHLMNTLFTDKSRPFYNFGSRYDLPVIAPEEWMPFICKLFKKGGYTFPETTCTEMLLFTQGHPYYTQLFASDLWERFRDTKNIKESDVVSTLPLILERESHAFAELWDSLSSPERKLVSALAGSSNETIFSHTFMSRNNLGALSSLQRTVTALTKRGLLRKAGGSYAVTDPLFLLWVKQGD